MVLHSTLIHTKLRDFCCCFAFAFVFVVVFNNNNKKNPGITVVYLILIFGPLNYSDDFSLLSEKSPHYFSVLVTFVADRNYLS